MALARILKTFLWRRREWNCCGWRNRAIVRGGLEVLMWMLRAAVARNERLRRALCFAWFGFRLIGAAFDEGAARDRGCEPRLGNACCRQTCLRAREDGRMRCWADLRGGWLDHAPQSVYFSV